MRLRYALRFWLVTLLVGSAGLFIFSFLLHNPTSTEIAAYGSTPEPWYIELALTFFRLIPSLLLITIPFFLIGLIFYGKSPSQNSNDNHTSQMSLFFKKTMIPAYITTIFTFLSPRILAINFNMESGGALVYGAMLMLILFMLIPINIAVWVICIRRSR